jgi:hypothetical protein
LYKCVIKTDDMHFVENLCDLSIFISKSHTIINNLHKKYGVSQLYNDLMISDIFEFACMTTYLTLCNILLISDYNKYLSVSALNNDERVYYDVLTKVTDIDNIIKITGTQFCHLHLIYILLKMSSNIIKQKADH